MGAAAKPKLVCRKDFVRWLERNGFARPIPDRGGGGHLRYQGRGITVAVPNHGSPHLSRTIRAKYRRQLTAVGFKEEELPV